MKKILILINHDVWLYNLRRELIETLLNEKCQIWISCPYGEKIEYFKSIGCKYIDSDLNRHGMNPINELKLILYFRKLVKKISPDLVLTYTIKPNLYGGLICRITHTPYISTVTGLGTALENPGVLQKVLVPMYAFAIRKAHCVFFQNKSNAKFAIKHGWIKNKYKVIPGSGVNTLEHCFEEYPEIKQYEDKILFIGRIMKDKGVEELFKAAALIHKKYPKVTFEMIGLSDEDYSSIIEKLSQKKIINYWGHRSDVHIFIKNSSAVILPSYHEGMANVLLEAASCGRPVLASKIPGCIETFDEGITGLGFEVRNVDDLYKTIKRFIELPIEKKIAMGKAGRKKVSAEFDRSIVVKAYMDAINELEETKK